jgi:protein-L-isoaspartate(D-aspartate) O-methyltransferase
MDLEQARYFMVEQQIRPWDVLDPKVLDLFLSIPRHDFVAEDQVNLAYSDIELPLPHNQNMLHPRVEARMLQALDIDEEDTVLEIGTGSGFNTALLASLGKHVTTVELHKDLQETAKQRLEHFANIDYQIGNACQDWNDKQQYDTIVLTGSVAEVPQRYLEKLALGGRMVVTTGQEPVMTCKLYTRIGENEWDIEDLFETVMAPLIDAEPKETFNF